MSSKKLPGLSAVAKAPRQPPARTYSRTTRIGLAQISIYLAEDDLEQAARLAVLRRCDRSQVIRDALHAALQKTRK